MRVVRVSGLPFVQFLRALLADPSWFETAGGMLARNRLLHAAKQLEAKVAAPTTAPAESAPVYALELESADFDRLCKVADAPRGGYAPETAEAAVAGIRALRAAAER